MENNKRLEIGIVSLAVLMLFSAGYFLMRVDKKIGVENFVENYVMPRPKALFNALFSLGDRDVERVHNNPFAKSKEPKLAAKAGQPPVPVGTTPQATVAKANKVKKSKKKDAAEKEKSFDVTVVEESVSGLEGGSDISMAPLSGGTVAGRIPQSPVVPAKEVEKQSAALGPDQWRSLMLAQPTEANLAKLIEAYSKKEIEARAFYMIVGDLMTSNKPEVQVLGIKAARAFPSAQSFQILVANEEALLKDNQKELEEAFATYAQSSRNGILIMAMQSGDREVIERAITIAMTSYQKAKEQSQSGNSDANLILISFARFIPVLQVLSTNEDPQIAQTATGALSQLQRVAAN